MARIRTIKPDFFSDEKLAQCSDTAKLLFIGLWVFGDDEGRMPYSAVRLKYQVFPGSDVDVPLLVKELEVRGLVELYEVEGRKYLTVPNFGRHQKISHATPSKYPAPTNVPHGTCINSGNFQNVRENTGGLRPELKGIELNRIEGNGIELNCESPPENSDELIERIALTHPSNFRENGVMKQVPPVQCDAIIRAIIRDGREVVEQGTKLYGQIVSEWPPGEKKFAIGPVKFFDSSEYLNGPASWRRGEVNKSEARILSNLEVNARVKQKMREKASHA